MRWFDTDPTPFLPIGQFAALLVAVTASSGAAAQDWIPRRCCPATDCNASEGLSVQQVDGGYRVEGVEAVLAHDDPRVMPSHDGQIHVCVRSGAFPFMSETEALIKARHRQVKCLFVPFTS